MPRKALRLEDNNTNNNNNKRTKLMNNHLDEAHHKAKEQHDER